MKSLEELKEIREKTLERIGEKSGKTRVVVGMATCGIAAGAGPVLDTLNEEVKAKGIEDRVSVVQTGCVGLCQYEPIIEVLEPGKEKVTYVKMNAEKAKEIAEKHLAGGQIVSEYTVSAEN